MTDLQVISRRVWGAQYPAGAGARALPTSEAWLHHSVTLAPDLAFRDLDRNGSDDDEAQAMRNIERIGQSRFGQGFSYNLAVMPSGRVYEGCGVSRVGAHTGGRNTRALGVVLVGDYSRVAPTEQQQDALVAILQTGHRLRWIDQPRFDGGHRDLAPTACPGAKAYALIPDLNRRAAGKAVTLNSGTGAVASAPTFTTGDLNMAVLALVRPGDRGESVRTVQGLLVARRHDLSQEGGVDGIYGPGMEREVKAFQKARGLAADGVVGPLTYARLLVP